MGVFAFPAGFFAVAIDGRCLGGSTGGGREVGGVVMLGKCGVYVGGILVFATWLGTLVVFFGVCSSLLRCGTDVDLGDDDSVEPFAESGEGFPFDPDVRHGRLDPCRMVGVFSVSF